MVACRREVTERGAVAAQRLIYNAEVNLRKYRSDQGSGSGSLRLPREVEPDRRRDHADDTENGQSDRCMNAQFGRPESISRPDSILITRIIVNFRMERAMPESG